MIFIFDKLTATIVAGFLFVMIVTLQLRVQSNSVEETLFYQSKKNTLSFAETLERDLANAGYRTTPGQDVITAFTNVQYDSTDVTTLFQFWGIAANGSRAEIRYVTTPTDSIAVAAGRVPAFRVDRFENTGGGWTNAGGSASTFVAFEIDTLDENGFETSLAETRRLRIKLSNAVAANTMAGEGNGNRVAHQLRWGITLAPVGLSLQGYQG
jgi:hypothetical protein